MSSEDKGGSAYIEHPLRVMKRVREEGTDAMIAAVLHDVIEDAGISADELRVRGFPETAIRAVETVTKRPEERGTDAGDAAFSERIATSGSRLAIVVKLADLADNADLSRLGRKPTDEDLARTRKYDRARHLLEGALAKLRSR